MESPSYSQFTLGRTALSHPPCQVLVLASGMQTDGTRAPGKGMEKQGLKSKVLLGLCEADCGSFSSFLLGRQAAYQFLEKQNTVVAQGHS